MEKNLGIIDRYLRVIFGEIIAIVGLFWLGSIWRILVVLIGLATIVTGAIGYCSVYKLLGWSTQKPDEQPLNSGLQTVLIMAVVVVLVVGLLAGWVL